MCLFCNKKKITLNILLNLGRGIIEKIPFKIFNVQRKIKINIRQKREFKKVWLCGIEPTFQIRF